MKHKSKTADSQTGVKESIRILQLAAGSLPISNPAWLSADGPVVSDPASAKGISATDNKLYIESNSAKLTHGGQTFAHDKMPLKPAGKQYVKPGWNHFIV